MSALTFWVLLAFLLPTHGRPPVMVIERFGTPDQCARALSVYQATQVRFGCYPSRQLTVHASSKDRQ